VKGLLAVVAAALLLALPAAPASAQERHSCGNYGYPKGHSGDKPVFIRKPVLGRGRRGHPDARDRLPQGPPDGQGILERPRFFRFGS